MCRSYRQSTHHCAGWYGGDHPARVNKKDSAIYIGLLALSMEFFHQLPSSLGAFFKNTATRSIYFAIIAYIYRENKARGAAHMQANREI